MQIVVSFACISFENKCVLCVYMEIWTDVTIAGRQTNEKGKIELLSHGPWKAEMSNLQILKASTYFLL